ncbi:hypothetical protein JCM8097_002214 [Rhodosporidiobolus ruineniae]
MVAVEHASDVWPAGQEYLRPIVCAAYLLVLGGLSILFSKRVVGWQKLKRLPIMQILVMSLLGCRSPSSLRRPSLSSASAVTKAVLYVLLLEKLHVVQCHSAQGRIPRYKSWWYRGGCVLFVAWLAVAITMIVGRIGLIRQHDGACVIGLRLYATVPMLTVDAITNIYLTSAFIMPIWNSNFPKAQRLARVSAIAAVAALITSFANILVLTLEHGHQLSWVCLGSCGLDVAFNSTAVFFVSTANRVKDEATTTAGSMDAGTGKGRTSRNASLFPGSHANPFGRGPVSVGGGVGVTVVEEIRVDEDRDIPLPPLCRPSQRPLVHHPTTISFAQTPRMDEFDDEDLDEKTPQSEKPATTFPPSQ